MATYVSTGYYSITASSDTIAGLSWNRLTANSLANRVDTKTLYFGSYGTIDLGTQSSGGRDWLNLMVNGNWNLFLYNTEYVTAGAGYSSVSLRVMNGAPIAFTTDGSLVNLGTGVAADSITINGVDGTRVVANNMATVSLNTGNDRLVLQNIAAKGRLDGGADRDKLALNAGADISNVDTIIYFEDLEINGDSTMTVRMNNQFHNDFAVVNKNAAATVKLVAYAKASPVQADETAYALGGIKNYLLQEKTAGAFNNGVALRVNSGTTDVNVTANGAFAMAVDAHGTAASGTFKLGAGVGTVRLSDGGSIAAATVKSSGQWSLAIDTAGGRAEVTVASKHLMGDANNNANQGITEAGGGTSQVNVVTGGLALGSAGASFVLDSDVDAWEIGLADADDNFVTLTDGQSVSLGSGADTVIYALAGAQGRASTFIDLGQDTAQDIVRVEPTITDSSLPLALRDVGLVGEVSSFVTSDAGGGFDVLDVAGLAAGLSYRETDYQGIFFNVAFNDKAAGWDNASTVVNFANLSSLNKIFLPGKTMAAFNLFDSTLYIDSDQSGFYSSQDFALEINGGGLGLSEFLSQNLAGTNASLPDREVVFDLNTYGQAFQVDMQTGVYAPTFPYASADEAWDANIVRLTLEGGRAVTAALSSRKNSGTDYTAYDTVDASDVGTGAITTFDFSTGGISVSAGTIGSHVTDIAYQGIERYIGGNGVDIVAFNDRPSLPGAGDEKSFWNGYAIELGGGDDEIYVDNVTLGANVFINSATNQGVGNSNDFLHLGGSADVSAASVTGFKRLWLDRNASVTMRNVGQYDQLVKDSKGYHVIGDGTGVETITFSEAGTFSAIQGVDRYVLSSAGPNVVTITALAPNSTENVSVTGGAASDTVTISGADSGTSVFQGTYALKGGSNIVSVTSAGAGADLADVIVTSVGGSWTLQLDGNSGAAVVAARHLYGANKATSVVATGNANVLTVKVVDGALGASGDYYQLASAVERWNIGVDVTTSNYVVLQNNGSNNAFQRVTAYGANDFFKAASLTFTSLDGGVGTDTLELTESGSINLANVVAVEKLVTSGAASTTLTNVATAFNHFTLGGGGNTFTSGAAGVTVVGGGAADLVTLSAASLGVLAIDLSVGADQLQFTAATSPSLGAGSVLDGGLGSSDILYLNNSAGTVTLDLVTGVTLSGFEQLKGGATNQTLVLNTGSLIGVTSIDLGGGSDVLDLRSGGTFDFSALTTFAGVETITAQNSAVATTVKLKAAQVSGITTLTGSAGADVLQITDDNAVTLPAATTAFETLKFGNAKLTLSAATGITAIESTNGVSSEVAWSGSGAADFTAVNFTGVKKLDVSSVTVDATFSASKLAGVDAVQGGAGTNLVIKYSGDNSSLATSLAVQGVAQFDTLRLEASTAGTLTVSNKLFNTTMVNLLGTVTTPNVAETLKFKVADTAPSLDLSNVTTVTNLSALRVEGSAVNDVIKTSSTDTVRLNTAIDLLASGGSDKVVINNVYTAATAGAVQVSNFVAANDQLFVSSGVLGNQFFEDFTGNASISANGDGDYYEITATQAATLTDIASATAGTVRAAIGSAVGGMLRNQTGIAIVYSNTTSTADAGVYHFTWPTTAADATAAGIGVELVGIISGVGYDNLSTSNCVFNANAIV